MPTRRRSALLDKLVVEQPGKPQQAILDEVRRVILYGAVPPGTPIPLADVADLFGVSQIPVREALKTLIGEGLVSHRSNAGYTVAQLTRQELREMYIVRETLESASLAAAIANATEADRAAITTANDMLHDALRADDPEAYHRRSRDFHLALVRPSHMHRLLHMLETAWNVTEPVQSMVHVRAADRADLHADHTEMVRAFLAGDVEDLLTAAETHSQRLNALIATLPTDTGWLAADISSPQ
ncbi:GntR family transcriptional regulator [Mycolicibacterium sp. 018/SC-01/001]|uniref:GntR family transcriptional regulator n=1 Tax=Mycolicibacterium sp. 018/SC-01/001 TaxID=2592069 RepID=UPI00117CCF72|nr:GntR family transcriptional regulator [Mycolicibacterium sp. 018/SC-01/001]TRW79856.1 GntR family transcriptional regulator [Mycolicibacterium sp. 018/SC-01/001]